MRIELWIVLLIILFIGAVVFKSALTGVPFLICLLWTARFFVRWEE